MKIAVVTGANRGLGFETSRQLARQGYKVYLACRDKSRGEAARDILRSEGLNVESIKMDITSTSDIRDIVDELKRKKEIPQLIINNAGVFLENLSDTSETSSVINIDPVIILKTIEVNTMGPLKLFQALVPLMLDEHNESRIINISSGMGQLKDMEGNWPGYRISKVALNALTKILDSEFYDKGLIVNSVCPGWVKTDMGGNNALRSVTEGVETTIWLSTIKESPNGKFFRDRQEIPW